MIQLLPQSGPPRFLILIAVLGFLTIACMIVIFVACVLGPTFWKTWDVLDETIFSKPWL